MIMYKGLAVIALFALVAANESGSGSSGSGSSGSGSVRAIAGSSTMDDYDDDDIDDVQEFSDLAKLVSKCYNTNEVVASDGDYGIYFDDDFAEPENCKNFPGCSVQTILMPTTIAKRKTIKFSDIYEADDLYDDDYITIEDWDAANVRGGFKICAPDNFQTKLAASGFSLDKYRLKELECQLLEGSPAECLAAGCGSYYDDDWVPEENNNPHWCSAHTHHGLKSSAALQKAADARLTKELKRFFKSDDDYYDDDILDYYVEEHAQLMMIADRCGSTDFVWDDDDSQSSCDLKGCSRQVIATPKLIAKRKTLNFDDVHDDDDDYDDYSVENWNDVRDAGGVSRCVPDDFEAQMATIGFSLDNYLLKQLECYSLIGKPATCLASGCGSATYDDDYYADDDEPHYCYSQSHHGLTSSGAIKEAAVEKAKLAADNLQKEITTLKKSVDTACATSKTSSTCKELEKDLAGARKELDEANAQLNAAESLDSATDITAPLVVLGLSAVVAFF
jgi:hypothetical protein